MRCRGDACGCCTAKMRRTLHCFGQICCIHCPKESHAHKGGEVDLVDPFVDYGSSWKIIPPLPDAFSSEMFPMLSASRFLNGTAISPQSLKDLVRGYESARSETGG